MSTNYILIYLFNKTLGVYKHNNSCFFSLILWDFCQALSRKKALYLFTLWIICTIVAFRGLKRPQGNFLFPFLNEPLTQILYIKQKSFDPKWFWSHIVYFSSYNKTFVHRCGFIMCKRSGIKEGWSTSSVLILKLAPDYIRFRQIQS